MLGIHDCLLVQLFPLAGMHDYLLAFVTICWHL